MPYPDQHTPAARPTLPRRLLLRGLGAGAALPLLAACAPPRAAVPAGPSASAPAPAASPAAAPSPSASPAAGQAFTVDMTDTLKFEPAVLAVPRGATVTWRTTGQMPHTATCDPSMALNKANAVLPIGAQPWDSGFVAAGQSWSYTFTTPGEYTYFCIPHEAAGMVARLTVTG